MILSLLLWLNHRGLAIARDRQVQFDTYRIVHVDASITVEVKAPHAGRIDDPGFGRGSGLVRAVDVARRSGHAARRQMSAPPRIGSPLVPASHVFRRDGLEFGS